VSLAENALSESGLNLTGPGKVAYRPHYVAKYTKTLMINGATSMIENFVDLGYNQTTDALFPAPANEISAEINAKVKFQKIYLMGLKPNFGDDSPWKASSGCNPRKGDANCVVFDSQNLVRDVLAPRGQGQFTYRVTLLPASFNEVTVDANGVEIKIPYTVTQSFDATDINNIQIGSEGVTATQLQASGQAAPQVSQRPVRSIAQRVMKNSNSFVVVEFDVHCKESTLDCPTKVESIVRGVGATFASTNTVKTSLALKTVAANACNKDALDANNQFCFSIVDDVNFARNKRRILKMAMSGLQDGADNSFEIKLVREDASGGKGVSIYTWNNVKVSLPNQ
jgi:hypothetical protein